MTPSITIPHDLDIAETVLNVDGDPISFTAFLADQDHLSPHDVMELVVDVLTLRGTSVKLKNGAVARVMLWRSFATLG